MGRLELGRSTRSFLLVCVASAVLAAVGWWSWHLVDVALGRSLAAQVASLGVGFAAGIAAYVGACRLLGVDELGALLRMRRRRG
jgi:putative peptidoglycan lipid II flippase